MAGQGFPVETGVGLREVAGKYEPVPGHDLHRLHLGQVVILKLGYGGEHLGH